MCDSEDEYVKDYKKVLEMFMDAEFNVAIPSNELDDVVSTDKTIIIKHTRSCYCYGDEPLPTQYFTVECENHNELTNKYIIHELIKQNLRMNCNHVYLEGFHNLHDNVYETMAGS